MIGDYAASHTWWQSLVFYGSSILCGLAFAAALWWLTTV